MRTVIFLGLLSIAFAVNDKPLDELVINFFAYIVLVVMIMDIIEFVNKLRVKK